MDIIRFKVWPKANDIDIVKRISSIVTGREDFFCKDSGYKYSLGTTNDWWMDKEGDVFIIAYRYASSPNFDQSKIDALKKVILWLLHIEDFNK